MKTITDYNYTAGILDDDLTARFNTAVDIENQLKRIKNVPIAKFDMNLKKPYLEYSDGRREYIED